MKYGSLSQIVDLEQNEGLLEINCQNLFTIFAKNFSFVNRNHLFAWWVGGEFSPEDACPNPSGWRTRRLDKEGFDLHSYIIKVSCICTL
ncbi:MULTISPECIES: hypothetical protein [Nostocales]|uniref:Uncharacterized protein n=3 Tax=Nostocales TaxID=1161 RepID=A0A8S9T1V8_9CYAN|nr:hypothetical protein [Tolypothrix bouteillei]KAF3886068.1 hypothetical protein DA73_0400011750 [Tolypothrix bouteillei VB521301]